MKSTPRVAPLAALALLGCTVVDVSYDGKACPCLDGWVCDDERNVCVQGVAGDVDAGAVDVVSFKAAWATPNSIRWRWELSGLEQDFYGVRLIVGESEQAVRDRSNVRVWTGMDNPELDHFTLPRTDGVDPLIGTVTDEHQPDTEYFALLEVVDTANVSSFSATIAQKRTALEHVESVPIISDVGAPATGFTDPVCYQQASEAPYQGAQHWEYRHYCVAGSPDPMPSCTPSTNPPPVCWGNANMGFTQPLTGLDEGAFDEAYLQWAVRIDDSDHALWAIVGLDYEDAVDSVTVGALTYRADGAYRMYQLPLIEFGVGFADIGPNLLGMMVGGLWADGATLRIDEAYIRW